MTPDEASQKLAHDAEWMLMQVMEVHHRLAATLSWLHEKEGAVDPRQVSDRVENLHYHMRPVMVFAEGVAKAWDDLPGTTRAALGSIGVSPADPKSRKASRSGTVESVAKKLNGNTLLKWLDSEILRVDEQQKNAVSALESLEHAVEGNARLLSSLKRVRERGIKENWISEIPSTDAAFEEGN